MKFNYYVASILSIVILLIGLLLPPELMGVSRDTTFIVGSMWALLAALIDTLIEYKKES